MARREGENQVLDVASLVLQSVKAAYDVWKKEKVLGYRGLGADFASVTGRKGADVRGSYG